MNINKLLIYLFIILTLPVIHQSYIHSRGFEVAVVHFSNESDEKNNPNGKWNWLSSILCYTLTDNLQFITNLPIAKQKDIERIKIQYAEEDFFDDEENYIPFGKRIGADYIIYGSYSIRSNTISLKTILKNIHNKKTLIQFTIKQSLKKINSLFHEQTTKLATTIVNNLSDSNYRYDQKSLISYNNNNPKSISFLREYMLAWTAYIQESNQSTIKYAQLALNTSPNDLNTLYLLGNAHSKLGEYSIAIIYYKKAFRLSKQWKLRGIFTRITIKIARLYHLFGQYKKSLKLLNKIAHLNEKKNDHYMLGLVYNNIGNYYKLKGEYDKIFIYINKALQTFYDIKNDRESAHSIILLGIMYYTKGEYKKAQGYFNSGLTIHQKKAHQESIFHDYIHIAELEKINGNYDESLEYLKRALKLAKVINLNLSITLVYNGFSSVYDLKNNYNSAKKYIIRSINIIKQNNYQKDLAGAYTLLGLIYYNKSKYKLALKYYTKALDINTNLNIKSSIAKDYTNLALVYTSQKKYNKAMTHYLKAYAIRKEIDDKVGMAITKNSFALIYINRDKDYDRAIKTYKNTLKDFKSNDYKEGIALSYWMIGLIYEKKENNEEAIKWYEKSRDMYLEMENPNHKNLQALIDNLKQNEKK